MTIRLEYTARIGSNKLTNDIFCDIIKQFFIEYELNAAPNLLSSFNLSTTTLNHIINNYSTDYIQSKIDLTLQQLKSGKIKTSVSGFLVRAIEEDFGGSGADIETLVAQQALEAGKLNPEMVLVDPMEFLGTHCENLKPA